MSRQFKNDGLVTVVVPVYNREVFVRECVESIQNQTYDNLKIVVVDDGSTDNTTDVVREMASKDARISLKSNPTNTGSMNTAIHNEILACSSEYFTWIGSDDTYIPSAIGQLVSQHQQNPEVDYVSCDMKMSRDGHSFCSYCGSAWPNWTGYASLTPLQQFDAKTYTSLVYRTLCPPFPWNGMWKNKFFVEKDITWIEYRGNTWSPDTLNGLHFFAHGMTMKHYNEFPLIKYRLHDTQDTETGAISEQIRCDVTLISAIHEWYESDMFLGQKLNEEDKQLQYLKRLKELIEHHASRFSTSSKLPSALADVATSALVYIWNKGIPSSTELKELKSFFREYL